MPINLVGNYPERDRIETGWLSFDLAVSGQNLSRNNLLGMPLSCGYHIYSEHTGLGKTVVSLSLLGKVASELKQSVAIMPTDTFDVVNLTNILEWSGMNKDVHIIAGGKSHDEDLVQLEKVYSKRGVCGALLDSVYACMSTAVQEGNPEDSSMGRDAKMTNTFSRQMFNLTMRANAEGHAKFFIMTNKLVQVIGAARSFGPPPMDTPRGKDVKQLTSIHIHLLPAYVNKKKVVHEYGRLLRGKVEKNNFGPANREFIIFTIGGVGIHTGLTAVFDAIQYGVAVEKKNMVYLHGEAKGKITELIEDFHNTDRFIPFIEALQPIREELAQGKDVKVVAPVEDDDEETDTVSEEAEETDSLIVPSMEE